MVTGVIITIVLIGGILQRIGSPERYLSRTEKLLRGAGHALEFRFTPAVDGKTAKHMEAQRLMDCEREHLRTLLPGSNIKPQCIITTQRQNPQWQPILDGKLSQ